VREQVYVDHLLKKRRLSPPLSSCGSITDHKCTLALSSSIIRSFRCLF
jgi:hypothetical protein